MLLRKENILHFSGDSTNLQGKVSPLRKGYYTVLPQPIAGDAPKDFIRAYEHGKAHYANKRNWPLYIAKVGHKWYPSESIMEHFLTRLGQDLGLKMADSCLRLAHGQLRFCSRYFLRPRQKLTHGAEVFIGYLGDKAFVHDVEDAREARNVFTFQFVQDAILHQFPEESFELLTAFIQLLTFDALIGNNDRHFYNWGFVESIHRGRKAEFAPIFDTARALAWNTPVSKISTWLLDTKRPDIVKKYAIRSRPKIGWEGEKDINHFELVRLIADSSDSSRNVIENLAAKPADMIGETLMSREFADLISEERKVLVLDLLSVRLRLLRECL